ncbi:hypothetical protein [Paenibacillus ferrarius]|uniref:hypothetical protein n=1 Tax=Paenibacillus ferrarius TaxID=1469647 RepID=UPI001301F26D|nr:hypothetical protein [Paenibacillus ferrarius]
MWNLYEIEKRYEEQVKEIERRSRRTHWYDKAEKRRFRLLPIAGGLSLLVLVAIGYF